MSGRLIIDYTLCAAMTEYFVSFALGGVQMCTTVFFRFLSSLSFCSLSPSSFFLQFSFWSRTHFFLAQWLCGRGHYMANGTVTFPIWRDSIVGMWTHLDSKSTVVWEERERKEKKEKNTPYWDGLSHLLCVPLCPKSSIVLKVSFKQYRFAPQ